MIKLVNELCLFIFKVFYSIHYRFANNEIIEFVQKVITYNYLRYFGVETEFGFVTLIGFPLIRKCPGSRIIVGKGVTIVSKSRGNVAGINHPVILATLDTGASIRIGEGCGLSGNSICAAKSIEIKEKVGLGANACLYDTDFHSTKISIDNPESTKYAKSERIVIEKEAWIGSNSMVLKGVKVGKGTIVGAGSVVRDNLENHVVAMGNPAKITKKNNNYLIST